MLSFSRYFLSNSLQLNTDPTAAASVRQKSYSNSGNGCPFHQRKVLMSVSLLCHSLRDMTMEQEQVLVLKDLEEKECKKYECPSLYIAGILLGAYL